MEDKFHSCKCDTRHLCYTMFLAALCFLTHFEVIISSPLNITVGFIGRIERIRFAKVVLEQSEQQLKRDRVVPEDAHFRFIFPEACSEEVDVLRKVKDLFEVHNADVLIGPECSSGMAIAGLAASVFNRPIFGYGSVSDNFGNKTKYSTLVRTWNSMGDLGAAVKAALGYFSWKNVAIIRSNTAECDTALSGILSELSIGKSHINIRTVITVASGREVDNALNTVKSIARIIILCFGWEPYAATNDFLLRAYEKKMSTSDYVYIAPQYIKLSTDQKWPWQDQNITERDRVALTAMYRNVLVIEAIGDSNDSLSSFLSFLETHNSTIDYAEAKESGFETSLPVIFDTVYLYGMALNKTITLGGDVSNGLDIRSSCCYVDFIGKSGKIIMNQYGDRIREYVVLSMNDSVFTPLIKIHAAIIKENDTIIRVPEALRAETFSTPSGVHPKDTPPCGFTMEVCLAEHVTLLISGASVCFVASLAVIALFCYYRKWRFEQSLIKMSWKLNAKDVKLFVSQPRASSKALSRTWAPRNEDHISMSQGQLIAKCFAMWDRMSRLAAADATSVSAMAALPDSEEFNAFASVKGVAAFAKCIKRKNLPVLKREHLLLNKTIKEMHHENVNSFLGAVIDDGPLLIICWRYAPKGSLLDIVMNDDIRLDDMFVASILKDVVSGLDYIHKSSLHYNGYLTISNCVVDSRWIVKLTDFGWFQFQEHLKNNNVLTTSANPPPQKLYHFAPEVLRKALSPASPNYYASMRAADVYSLAFVIYHVIFRVEPLYDEEMTAEEILDRIKKTGVDPFRPHTPESTDANPNLVALMHRCWQEDPGHRPMMAEIKASFQLIFQQCFKGSLLDHMMSTLEKYATNLEKVVEERTQQLESERRRCDQLLYQMLPKSVADMLKRGLSVEPESYESVTIYFSDIVGFTSLSSESTPVEIVTMLNRLYSEFDETLLLFDVYKVETIGDAYMVVSGLPHRNGNKHVTEICDTALSILNVAVRFQIPHKPGRQIRLRIGVHTGPVAAGVVGLTMPRFCLFGDTVNTASRMESSGEPCKVHISDATESQLQQYQQYVIQLRGQGKGLMTTYWLNGKKPNAMVDQAQID